MRELGAEGRHEAAQPGHASGTAEPMCARIARRSTPRSTPLLTTGGGTDLEESREGLEEGKVPDQEAYMGTRSMGSESDETSRGRDAGKDARRQEAQEGAEWAKPRPPRREQAEG